MEVAAEVLLPDNSMNLLLIMKMEAAVPASESQEEETARVDRGRTIEVGHEVEVLAGPNATLTGIEIAIVAAIDGDTVDREVNTFDARMVVELAYGAYL